jgi:hypothetical protein
MPNKHFCQGPRCHERVTQDRFLKSRGVIRGRYAILPRDHDSEYYGRGKFFCSTGCENQWLDEHMTAIEMRIPVPFITHRRESQGYEKVTETVNHGWGDRTYNSIKRVDNRTELD